MRPASNSAPTNLSTALCRPISSQIRMRLPLLIEKCRGMKSPGAFKDRLFFADNLGGLDQKFDRMLRTRGIKVNFPIHLQGLERSLSADATARRSIKMTFQPLQIERLPVTVTVIEESAPLRYFLNGVPIMKDAFRVEEPDREFLILSRGAHGDRNRFAHQGIVRLRNRRTISSGSSTARWSTSLVDLILRPTVPANTKISNARGFHEIRFSCPPMTACTKLRLLR